MYRQIRVLDDILEVIGDDKQASTCELSLRLIERYDSPYFDAVYGGPQGMDFVSELRGTLAEPYKSGDQLIVSRDGVLAAIAEYGKSHKGGLPGFLGAEARMTALEAKRKKPTWREIVPSTAGYVYFIQAHYKEVKIGFSDDPYKRRTQLQTAQAHPLRVLTLCPGPQGREDAFHEMLAPHRLSGEWFAWCPEVQAVVKTVQMLTGFSGDGQLW